MKTYTTPLGERLTLDQAVKQERHICDHCDGAVIGDEYIPCDYCECSACVYCWQTNDMHCPDCGRLCYVLE